MKRLQTDFNYLQTANSILLVVSPIVKSKKSIFWETVQIRSCVFARVSSKLDCWLVKAAIGANATKCDTFCWTYSSELSASNMIMVPCEWPMYLTLSTPEISLTCFIKVIKSFFAMSWYVKSQYNWNNLSLPKIVDRSSLWRVAWSKE